MDDLRSTGLSSKANHLRAKFFPSYPNKDICVGLGVVVDVHTRSV